MPQEIHTDLAGILSLYAATRFANQHTHYYLYTDRYLLDTGRVISPWVTSLSVL